MTRCERCDESLEGTVGYVHQHGEVYCWLCVQSLAEAARLSIQEGLDSFAE